MVQYTRSLAKVTTAVKGTDSYWAPELLESQEDTHVKLQSEKTDVWAFGMTVYVCTSSSSCLSYCVENIKPFLLL